MAEADRGKRVIVFRAFCSQMAHLAPAALLPAENHGIRPDAIRIIIF